MHGQILLGYCVWADSGLLKFRCSLDRHDGLCLDRQYYSES